MSEHLTQNQIEDFSRQALSGVEFLSASRHMRGCDVCRLKIERVFDGDEAFFAMTSEVFNASDETDISSAGAAHLTFERMAEFVDGALTGEDLQVVDDHLGGCEQCVMAVNDLRAFRDQVTPGLDREYHPHPVSNENRWLRFVAAIRSFLAGSPGLIVGSAIAAILMVAAGWLILQSVDRNVVKIVQTNPSPTTSIPVVSPDPTQQGTERTVIAQLNDGAGQVVLNGNGQLSGVERLSPAYQQMIKNALSSQRLERPELLAELVRNNGISVRGGDNQGAGFSVINPAGIVMFSDRPTFRWSSLEGANGYIVEIFDDKLSKIIASPQLTQTSWTATQSLKRGAFYSWQVTALKGGEQFSAPRAPAPPAKFRILDQAQANELVQARRDFASSHLTLALLYTRAGLLDEAEQEFRELQKANPDSEISRRLMASLKAMRR